MGKIGDATRIVRNGVDADRVYLGGSLVWMKPAGAFHPLDLSPSLLIDPGNIGTLWQDTAGTVPVVADGDQVHAITMAPGVLAVKQIANDYSALGDVRYRANGGKPYLEFVNSGIGYMQIPVMFKLNVSTIPNRTTAMSLFVAHRTTDNQWTPLSGMPGYAYLAWAYESSSGFPSDRLAGDNITRRLNGVDVTAAGVGAQDWANMLKTGADMQWVTQGADLLSANWNSEIYIMSYMSKHHAYTGRLYGYAIMPDPSPTERDQMEAWMSARYS